MNINDKVIYTDTNGAEWGAVLLRTPTEQIDGKDAAVISMDGGWPIYVPKDSLRTTNRTKKVIANDIVRTLTKIDRMRTDLYHAYNDLRALLEEDGQPEWETKMVDDMQTVQRNVLRFETTNLLTQWEGYRDARGK